MRRLCHLRRPRASDGEVAVRSVGRLPAGPWSRVLSHDGSGLRGPGTYEPALARPGVSDTGSGRENMTRNTARST